MSDKILVVDDDEEIRDVLRILLTGERFEVAEAGSGEEALRYLAEHAGEVDLVILDVMMEGISGYHVCLRLREEWNVPVLFLTAKSKESDLTMGYSSGGDDYLVKPFSYPELLARVKGLLRRDSQRGLSNGERKMLHTAKQILISELVLAQSLPYDAVESSINSLLSH